MVANVLDVLDELRSRAGAADRWVELDRCAPDTGPEERAFFARYEEAVDQVRSRWGEPVYEGLGPRRGYKGPGPGGDLIYYNSAVRIAWWQLDDCVTVVMATGHDADSLFCLILAVVAGRVAT